MSMRWPSLVVGVRRRNSRHAPCGRRHCRYRAAARSSRRPTADSRSGRTCRARRRCRRASKMPGSAGSSMPSERGRPATGNPWRRPSGPASHTFCRGPVGHLGRERVQPDCAVPCVRVRLRRHRGARGSPGRASRSRAARRRDRAERHHAEVGRHRQLEFAGVGFDRLRNDRFGARGATQNASSAAVSSGKPGICVFPSQCKFSRMAGKKRRLATAKIRTRWRSSGH